MSEVTFAKSFLATLDKRQIKLPADHISDPRQYPSQSPYILPRQTHPFSRKSGPTSTQKAQEKLVAVTLRPMRTGETVTLTNITLDTTIHDLKTQYASQTGLQQDKIKLLLHKKPAADLKTLKDLGVDGNSDGVELSVMLLAGAGGTPGGAQSPTVASNQADVASPPVSAPAPLDRMEIDEKTAAPESEKATAAAATKGAESSAAEALRTDEFWADLQGFLSQRLRDEQEAQKLAKVFREAWKKV